jgi:hypothetical protein
VRILGTPILGPRVREGGILQNNSTMRSEVENQRSIRPDWFGERAHWQLACLLTMQLSSYPVSQSTCRSGRSHNGTLKNKRELREMATHTFVVVEERIIVKGPIVN